MAWLLDTNAWIQYWKNPGSLLADRVRLHLSKDIVTCAVVRAELLHGAEKYANRDERHELVVKTFSGLESHPFDDFAADYYALIRHHLEIRGKLIGPNDLMIAAIARSRGLILVTQNTSEFSRVDGLRIEDWTLPETPESGQ